MRRVVAALVAALLGIGSVVAGSPGAHADPPTTYYVFPDGNDAATCTSVHSACQTVQGAVGKAGAGDIVDVGAGDYSGDVSIAVPLTLTHTDAGVATLWGTVQIENTGDLVTVSNLSFAGTQAGIIDDQNSGPTVVNGNAFALTGSTAAITLKNNGATPLDAVVGGNSGTVTAPALTIDEQGPYSIVTPTLNTITTAASALTLPTGSVAATTFEPPTDFFATVMPGTDLPRARVDVSVMTALDPTASFDLAYSTDSGTTFKPLPLLGNASPYVATLGDVLGADLGVDQDLIFRLTAHDNAGPGIVTMALTLDEVDTTGSVINTVADGSVNASIVSNSPPVATPQTGPDSVDVAHDSSGTTVTLAANDADSDPLTYTVDSSPAHGKLSGVAPDLKYIPDAGYVGTDSFTFTADDGKAGPSVPATVEVDVAAGTAPAATAETLPDRIDLGLATTTIDLSRYVSETDADPLTYDVDTGTTRGTATLAGAIVSYTPPSTGGTDTFDFWAENGSGTSDHATITLTVDTAPVVTPLVSTPSVMHNDTGQTHSVAVEVSATDADQDTPSWGLDRPPASHGTVLRSGATFTYTPATDFVGTDHFTVYADDGHGGVTNYPLEVDVTNTPPTAVTPVTKHVSLGKSVTIQLSATDPDHDTLSYRVVRQPTHGTVKRSKATLTYTAPTNWAGQAVIPFTVNDKHGGTSAGAARVIVNKAASSLSLSLSPSRPTCAQHAKLTVRVSSAPGDPTNGIVTVGSQKAKVQGGVATLSLPRYAGGTHTVTASFGGSSTTLRSAAVSKRFTVSKVASSLRVTTNPVAITARTRNAVATVTIAAGPYHPSSGTVSISELPSNGAPPRLLVSGKPSSGVARLGLPSFSLGQHNLRIAYDGTDFVRASTTTLIERVAAGS